mmetsp:Transcript_20917/g.33730  ORF Transcript_20917/g.33730 Transcript_20917/m.33730 type:complete len:80 (-) Transcript_20917:54-293(-)
MSTISRGDPRRFIHSNSVAFAQRCIAKTDLGVYRSNFHNPAVLCPIRKNGRTIFAVFIHIAHTLANVDASSTYGNASSL